MNVRVAVLTTIAVSAIAIGSRGEGRVIQSGEGPPLQTEETVDVTAERFSFTPSEIRVKTGTRLQIRLQSEDTDHGFKMPGTEIDVRIPKRNRGTKTVTFEAAKPGRYVFQCSHVCGAGHSFMRGEIVVTE